MPGALPKRNMTHEEIAARNIVECYVLGKLSAEEAASFEEHFVDCQVCLDQLEAVERFRTALKPMAADAVRPAPVQTASRYWRNAWLVAAGFVLAVGASLVLAVREVKLRGELERSAAASRDWQQRYEKEHAATEARQAPLVASTFYLNVTRGADAPGSEPANRVMVPADSHWIVLSLEGQVDTGFRTLRAGMTDAAGKDVWRQDGLRVTPRAALSVVLPSAVLRGGDYVLTLEGLLPNGRYVSVGRYRFRAVAQ